MTEPLDSMGMLTAAAGLPEQIERAVDAALAIEGLPDPERIENVVILGMGGSGVVGDLVPTVVGPFMPIPIVVHKGYACPSFVSTNSLVIGVSFSGNTEETLEAMSMASDFGAHLVAITQGGALVDVPGVLHVPVADDIPAPRAGLGAMVAPAVILIERMGWFRGGHTWLEQAVTQLRRRRDQLMTPDNPAEVLARRLVRQIPIVYGAGSIGRVASLRWKNQWNENAKGPAFANFVPELTHNEICGWGLHGDATRQLMSIVHLRHDLEHPQEMHRFELMTELTSEVVADIHTVDAEGEGALAQLLDLILFGDFVSVYAAYEAGVDPGPVPSLDYIKEQLRAG